MSTEQSVGPWRPQVATPASTDSFMAQECPGKAHQSMAFAWAAQRTLLPKPEHGPRPLVQLAHSPGNPGPALFCPHPVSGTVVGYYPLAASLAPEWQVWGIQNRQILDRRWRDTSLAEMAEDYVHFLLEQQPRGPST